MSYELAPLLMTLSDL